MRLLHSPSGRRPGLFLPGRRRPGGGPRGRHRGRPRRLRGPPLRGTPRQGCASGACGTELDRARRWEAKPSGEQSRDTGELSPIQQAFIDAGAVQCGFCTPGLLVAADELLERNPEPSDADIREALSGNLCRCTGYETILDAVRLAAARAEETV